MNRLLQVLSRSNAALYRYGWFCAAGTLVCLVLLGTSNLQVGGLPAALKPLKFFLSIWIAVWTLGWMSGFLTETARRHYTIATIAAMSIELLIICGQAARGQASHFNTTTLSDSLLFSFMGLAITAFTVWTAVVAWKFFRPLNRPLPRALLWGIRIGLIAFVVFGFEGGIMGAILKHSIGGPDDAGGFPVLHWSARYGDLRIAHFFGLHSLQVLPLLGWVFRKKPLLFWSGTAIYLGLTTALLIRALLGLPL